MFVSINKTFDNDWDRFQNKREYYFNDLFYTGAGSYTKATSYKLGLNFELETAAIGKLWSAILDVYTLQKILKKIQNCYENH